MTQADHTRRTLLQGLVLALGGDQATPLAWLGRQARSLHAWFATGPAAVAPTALSEADLDDIVAFAEIVVGGGPLPATERGMLVEHLHDRQTQGDQYRVDLFRTTARLLTRLGGSRFATLDAAERAALVTRHRLAVADALPGEAVGDAVRAVRTRLVPDLIGAYYASAAGWNVVGYRVFPGRCGDLTRYTRPEA